MDFSLRLRLSVMMFLQYFVWGAWGVVLGTFLSSLPTNGGLNFPGGYVGLIFGTSAIGAMISPVFVGLFADRLFATEKVLAVLHLAGAALLGWAAYTCQQSLPEARNAFESVARETTLPGGEEALLDAIAKEKRLQEAAAEEGSDLWEWLGLRQKPRPPAPGKAEAAAKELAALREKLPPAIEQVNNSAAVKAAVDRAYHPLFWAMLLYALCYMPTITLTNSLSFRNLSDPDRYFGGIRVLGTIGWIVAGWVVSFAIKEVSPEPLYLAAGASVVLGLFCFALPHTPPSREAKSLGEALGLPALRMLGNVSFLVFVVCSLVMMIPLSFYYSWANRFLTDVRAPYPTALQTIGQISEIFFMLMIPVGLRHLGTKWMLVIGYLAWCLRYAVFATKNVPAVIAIGLPLHGICYDFFFVVSYLYVDRQAPKHLRASAQGLITFITLGVGLFLGNWLAGAVKQQYTVGDAIDYAHFWMVPLAIAAGSTLLFALLFREPKGRPPDVTIPEALDALTPVEPPEQVH
jgi:nucleoside transporter